MNICARIQADPGWRAVVTFSDFNTKKLGQRLDVRTESSRIEVFDVLNWGIVEIIHFASLTVGPGVSAGIIPLRDGWIDVHAPDFKIRELLPPSVIEENEAALKRWISKLES